MKLKQSSLGKNNVVTEKVNSIKYLGFIIDRGLELKKHLEYVCRKIGRKIGFFTRLKKNYSMLTSLNIYNTVLKSHFEYGLTILYACCTEQQLKRLYNLQNTDLQKQIYTNYFYVRFTEIS